MEPYSNKLAIRKSTRKKSFEHLGKRELGGAHYRMEHVQGDFRRTAVKQ